MCDKLQTSKDGSVDLCHGRLAEYQRSVQQYSSSSSSGDSSSNRKQRKFNGKGQFHIATLFGYLDSNIHLFVDNSSHRTGSDWSDQPFPFNGRGYGSGQSGSNHGQRWPKQGRKESKKSKVTIPSP